MAIILGIAHERAPGERRLALTPETCKKLVAAGVQPSEVNLIYTDDAFQAAAAFHADKSLAGAVSWSPDIYKLAEARGNRMLVTSQTANKLIAERNPEIEDGGSGMTNAEAAKIVSSKSAAEKASSSWL